MAKRLPRCQWIHRSHPDLCSFDGKPSDTECHTRWMESRQTFALSKTNEWNSLATHDCTCCKAAVHKAWNTKKFSFAGSQECFAFVFWLSAFQSKQGSSLHLRMDSACATDQWQICLSAICDRSIRALFIWAEWACRDWFLRSYTWYDMIPCALTSQWFCCIRSCWRGEEKKKNLPKTLW